MTGSVSSGANRAGRCHRGVHAGFAPAGAADAGVVLFRACHYPPSRRILARIQQEHPMLTGGLESLEQTIPIAGVPWDPYPVLRWLKPGDAGFPVQLVGRTFLT